MASTARKPVPPPPGPCLGLRHEQRLPAPLYSAPGPACPSCRRPVLRRRPSRAPPPARAPPSPVRRGRRLPEKLDLAMKFATPSCTCAAPPRHLLNTGTPPPLADRAGRHECRRRPSLRPPLSKVKTPSKSPSTPLCFPLLTRVPRPPGRRRRHRSVADWPPGESLSLPCSKSRGRRRPVLRITPCEKVNFSDLFLCLANFQKTPYKESTFTHKAHPRPFIDLTLFFYLFASTV
jgi:hypothetical protein